jgi:hypothetical protein
MAICRASDPDRVLRAYRLRRTRDQRGPYVDIYADACAATSLAAASVRLGASPADDRQARRYGRHCADAITVAGRRRRSRCPVAVS